MHREIRVYNTLTRTLEPFAPDEPGHVRMYVCGMTVYDYCHIGHARAMIVFDVVYRWLQERGWRVSYVSNYTDVDDKIIARAAEAGEDPLALSRRFIDALDEDAERLGIAPPTVRPKVSEHVPQIIDLVQALIVRGHAYAVPTNHGGDDVFYAVESFGAYGKLSGKRLEEQRAGERVEIDSRKQHPFDFSLWKAAKPGEPAWDSPWGPGRPGWHIECSAMSTEYLGRQFDIHGGGIDLVFPHHENEIAQSEGATGEANFARVWMHNGHLTMGTEKMSKSLGNIVRIRDILNEVPAEALRLLYLESHYRSPLPYSTNRLTEAMVGLDRLYHAREVLEDLAASAPMATADELARDLGEPARDLIQRTAEFADRFATAMDDDFGTAQALGLLFELARCVNRFGNNKKWRKRSGVLGAPALAAFDLAGRVLGVGGRSSTEWFGEVRRQRLAAIGKTEAEIAAQIERRNQARRDRDWAAADAVRDELAALGVVLMDSGTDTLWRMRVD